MAMKGKGLEIESQLVHGVYQLSRSLNIAAEGQTKKAFNQQSSRDARWRVRVPLPTDGY